MKELVEHRLKYLEVFSHILLYSVFKSDKIHVALYIFGFDTIDVN